MRILTYLVASTSDLALDQVRPSPYLGVIMSGGTCSSAALGPRSYVACRLDF